LPTPILKKLDSVPQEFKINEPSVKSKDFDKAEVKKTMRQEAAKPLLLMRED